MPDGEWLIIKVEAVVEGAVELASGVVWGVGVETDWISDEVETLAQPLSANLELGAGVSQPGFDTNFLNLDGVAAFQDLGAGQESVGGQVDESLFAGFELGELGGELVVEFNRELLLISQSGCDLCLYGVGEAFGQAQAGVVALDGCLHLPTGQVG